MSAERTPVRGSPWRASTIRHALSRQAADAAYIVRACNSHDALVAALAGLLARAGSLDQSATHDGLLNCDALAHACAALAAAQGSQGDAS